MARCPVTPHEIRATAATKSATPGKNRFLFSTIVITKSKTNIHKCRKKIVILSSGMNFTTSIKTALLKVYPFTEQHLQLVIEKIHLQSFKRHDYLLAPPKTCSFTAFVVKGSFRMFKITEEKENTLHFFTETDWIGDIES